MAASSSSFGTPSGQGRSSDPPAEPSSPLRPLGGRSRAPAAQARGGSPAFGASDGEGGRPVRLGLDAQPLDAGEDAAFAIVEPILDVRREKVPAARRADAERHRHRIVGLVRDGDRDATHAELLGARRGTAVEAHAGLAGRQPLDLDVTPADAPDAEPEHLRDRLLGRPATGHRLRPASDVALLGRRQDPVREAIAEAFERRADALDADDVDAELRGRLRRVQPVGEPRGDVTRLGHPYSTVTDFARLRGWSTSVPRAIATW